VRSGDYKLIIQSKDEKPQLYNLDTDIGEENEIADQHPQELQRLEALRAQWDSELIEPRFLGLMHRILERQEKSKKKAQKQAEMNR
jgi:hypothetical protein